MARTRKIAHKKRKRHTAIKNGGGWFSFLKSKEEREMEEQVKQAEKELEEIRRKESEERRIQEEEKRKKAAIDSQNIMEAIKNKDEAALKTILDNRPNIAFSDNDGLTPLHHAILQENNAIFQLLIDYAKKTRSYVDARDNESQTPLLFAYLYKQYDNAKKLIDAGANINILDRNKDTLLMKVLAMIEDDEDHGVTVEIIQHMREDGANPYLTNKQELDAVGYLNRITMKGMIRSQENMELIRQIYPALTKIYTFDQSRKISSWGGGKKKTITRRRVRLLK